MWPDWIDSTVRLSDVVLLGSGLWAFIRTYFAQQHFNRDVLRTLGSKTPPDGVLGDVSTLKEHARRHNDQLIKIRARQGWRERVDDNGDDT